MMSRKDYDRVLEVLKEKKTRYFTYPTDPALTITRILKRISAMYTADDVQEEIILATGISCTVSEMTSRGHPTAANPNPAARRLPMFRVAATKEQMAVITKTSLFAMDPRRMIWELPRKQPIIQCFRCQRYGHSSRFCAMTPRCVKCSLIHEEGACTNNSRDTPAWCVNCGVLGHPANFRKCPKYLLALRRMEDRQERDGALQKARTVAAPSMPVTSGVSFASVLGNQSQR